MASYYVKAGDAGLPTPQTFLEDADGVGVSLAGASVRYLMRGARDAALKVDGVGTIEDALTGEVSYTWDVTDLDTPGLYYAEWEVTYAGGAIETFPASSHIRVYVRDDLD